MTTLKILVFSDSHRYLNGMYCAIEEHKPDQVIHLGDLQDDAEEVAMVYPRLPICMVPGNCDGWTTEAATKLITIDGVKILLGHGHLWHVKQGYETAILQARKAGADLLLFGHTHVAVCRQLEDGLWMMNPGTAQSTFGIITIENGSVTCTVEKLP